MPILSKYQIDVLLQKQAELYLLQQGYGIGAELAPAMAVVRDKMTDLAAGAVAAAADAETAAPAIVKRSFFKTPEAPA